MIPKYSQPIRQILQSALTFSGSRFVSIFARIIYIFAVARMLGDESYGQLVYAQSWYLVLFPFGMFGLAQWQLKSFGQSITEETRILNIAGKSILVTSISATILCLLIAFNTARESELFLPILFFSLALIGRALSVWGDGVFVAYQRAEFTLKITSVFRMIEPVFAVIILSNHGGLTELAALHMLGWLMQAIITYCKLNGQFDISGHKTSLIEIADTLKKSFPYMGYGLSTSFLYQIPLILFAQIHEGKIGHYALIMQFLVNFSTLSLSMGQALLPALSRAHVREDNRPIEYAKRLQWLLLAMGICGGGGLVYVSEPMVMFVLGDQFVNLAKWLPASFFVLMLNSIIILFHQVMISKNNLKFCIISRLFSLSIVSGSMIYFVPNYSEAGAILALLLGLFAESVLVSSRHNTCIGLGIMIIVAVFSLVLLMPSFLLW